MNRMYLYNKYTFDSFVSGVENEAVKKFLEGFLEEKGNIPGNVPAPVTLYGALGLGKTHLIQAYGNAVLAKDSDVNIVYTTGESLMNFGTDGFCCEPDLLLVDDIQNIKSEDMWKKLTEVSKGLNERGKKVIFTSDRHPDALELCEEAKEFLKKGSILEINWPGYECRRKILDKKIKEHFLNDPEIQEEVLDYIAAHGKENVRILEGLLNKAVAMARLERVKAVDLAFAKESLEESISLIG